MMCKQYSPYKLLQEQLRNNPWKMFVACMMLNQTSFKQVRPMIWKFFRRFPNATKLAQADTAELASILKPLGFYNKRARTLKKFSEQYSELESKATLSDDEVLSLYGVGKYAKDSYSMFVLNDVEGTAPTDKKLLLYKDWYESQQDDSDQ